MSSPLTGPQVFGNSNSLPISLVISLAQTLRGLHWDKVPNDNDDEVGARGILYLLIFQQLGQLLRWSWGYNVLLAPAHKYSEEDGGSGASRRLEQGSGRYRDDPEDDDLDRNLLDDEYPGYDSDNEDDEETRVGGSSGSASPGAKTPPKSYTRASNGSSRSTSPRRQGIDNSPELLPTPANGNLLHHQNGTMTSFPNVDPVKAIEDTSGRKGIMKKTRDFLQTAWSHTAGNFGNVGRTVFRSLPIILQSFLVRLYRGVSRFMHGLWEFMNPPLWAMLVAIIVASVPKLQHLFFTEGTFVQNSVTRAIGQSAGVAVPLILVVLGGNLAR